MTTDAYEIKAEAIAGDENAACREAAEKLQLHERTHKVIVGAKSSLGRQSGDGGQDRHPR
jgi:hypothetical protein